MKIWTDERTELLRQMWGDGLSASQCAAALGVPDMTRSAVIGKAHRLGLKSRKRQQRPRSVAPKPKRQNGTAFHTAPSITSEPLDASTFAHINGHASVALLDLENHHCRWPMDDGKYCGRQANVLRGFSYCQAHASIAGQMYRRSR